MESIVGGNNHARVHASLHEHPFGSNGHAVKTTDPTRQRVGALPKQKDTNTCVPTSIKKSPVLSPACHATPPSSTDSRYCRAGNAGVGVNSSMGVSAGKEGRTARSIPGRCFHPGSPGPQAPERDACASCRKWVVQANPREGLDPQPRVRPTQARCILVPRHTAWPLR